MRYRLGSYMFQATLVWTDWGLGFIVEFKLRLIEIFIGPIELSAWRRKGNK